MTILKRWSATSSTGSSETGSSKTGSSEVLLAVAGRAVAVRLRINPRARRLLLRVDAHGAVTLTMPSARRRGEALRFLDSRRDWVAARLAATPQPLPIAIGAVIPLLGEPHAIRHDPAARHPLLVADGEIVLGGPAPAAAARLGRWLKLEARRQLAGRSAAKAAGIGRAVGRVTVRDTRSRWGSCSRTGALSFSWRLILAPERVLDYVAAHEVAHLAEFDHGPGFWALVGRLHPAPEEARLWLRRHGEELHRYTLPLPGSLPGP